MASCVGIDIGANNCKIVERAATGAVMSVARMPDNVFDSAMTVSKETLGSFLKDMRSEHRVRERSAVVVLAQSQAFFRHVTLPRMSASEVELNLPYEFRDFVTGDPGEYLYDYCIDQAYHGQDAAVDRLELFAAATPRKLAESYSIALKKAGFKPRAIIPAPMAYAAIMASYIGRNPIDADRSCVLVDIGYTDVTITLMRGSHYEASKTVEVGCSDFDRIIADVCGVDPYTAGSYKYDNFQGVLDGPECLALCERYAIEVSKVVNFYNFSSRDKDVEQMYFLGGGARIRQLTEAITNAVSVPAASIDALYPDWATGAVDGPVCALALGGLLEGEAM